MSIHREFAFLLDGPEDFPKVFRLALDAARTEGVMVDRWIIQRPPGKSGWQLYGVAT